jgi:hypothetical protein
MLINRNVIIFFDGMAGVTHFTMGMIHTRQSMSNCWSDAQKKFDGTVGVTLTIVLKWIQFRLCGPCIITEVTLRTGKR